MVWPVQAEGKRGSFIKVKTLYKERKLRINFFVRKLFMVTSNLGKKLVLATIFGQTMRLMGLKCSNSAPTNTYGSSKT